MSQQSIGKGTVDNIRVFDTTHRRMMMMMRSEKNDQGPLGSSYPAPMTQRRQLWSSICEPTCGVFRQSCWFAAGKSQHGCCLFCCFVRWSRQTRPRGRKQYIFYGRVEYSPCPLDLCGRVTCPRSCFGRGSRRHSLSVLTVNGWNSKQCACVQMHNKHAHHDHQEHQQQQQQQQHQQ